MKTLLRWIGRLATVAVGFVLVLQLYYFTSVGYYAHVNPSSTAFMKSHLALAREKNPDAKLDFQWVPYARISDQLKRAVITSEDARFAEHDGVDWDAIAKAYENNEKIGNEKIGNEKVGNEKIEKAGPKGGKARQRARIKGGSTITQQLAKNLFLSGERSYLRKGQELVITYMIEFWMPKERILEVYLNVIEWGNGVFGAEAAARHYHGIPAAQLSAGQAAQLAVMLPNPRYYDTHRGSPFLARRANAVLRWMPDAELP